MPGHSLTAQRKASHTKDQKPKCEKIRQWSSSSDIVDIPEQQQQQHHHHHQRRQNCCSEIPRRRSRCANESLLRATTTAFGKRETVASSFPAPQANGPRPGSQDRGAGWSHPTGQHLSMASGPGAVRDWVLSVGVTTPYTNLKIRNGPKKKSSVEI